MNGDRNPYGSSPSVPEEPTEAGIAQMMGFSNFGSKPKPQSNKRKRELAQLATSGPGAESGSGSNTMPLGNPTRRRNGSADSLGKGEELDRNTLKGENSRTGGSDRSRQVHNQRGDGSSHTSFGEQGKPALLSHERTPSAIGGQQSQDDWHALRKGIRDSRGDIAYYDTSFVEDPWKDLG